MNRLFLSTATGSLLLLLAAGCSSNRIVGSELTEEGHWQGELGITGHLNRIIVRQPSNLTKLSIIGDANRVFVEDHVPLGKIEVWGSDNVISIPQHLVVRVNQIGKRTQVVRRPRGMTPEEFFESAPFAPPAGEIAEPPASEPAPDGAPG